MNVLNPLSEIQSNPAVYHPCSGGQGQNLGSSRFNLWYGATQALFDVTFAVERGLVTTLIGPSGW